MLELRDVRAATEMRAQEPFLDDDERLEDEGESEGGNEVTRSQAWCLYLSHFLSMWNSRMYEFGAVSSQLREGDGSWFNRADVLVQILFIQSAFPGNLTASSIKYVVLSVWVFGGCVN